MYMITSQIRIPEDIWEKIRALSVEEERTINSQIVYILKKYIEETEKKEKEIKDKK